MSTAIKTVDQFEPVKFSVTEKAIAELRARYLPLSISGADDKAGYTAVHEGRMVCKKLRVDVKARHKELKAPILERGRQIDAAANWIIDQLEPIESHLKLEEDGYNAAKEAEKRAAADLRQKVTEGRCAALVAVGCMANPVFVSALDDDGYEALLALHTDAFEKKQAAEAAERERLAAEKAELAAERERQEAVKREQQAEADRLDTERAAVERERQRQAAVEAERIESERLAAEHAEAQRRQAEAAEAERQANFVRQKRAAEEAAQYAAERELEAEQERQRAEALRPDREKLAAYVKELEAVAFPEIADAPLRKRFFAVLNDAFTSLRKELE